MQAKAVQTSLKDPSKYATAEDVERIITEKLQQLQHNGNTLNGKQQASNVARRGRIPANKIHIECFKCHKLGHYANECFNLDNKASNMPATYTPTTDMEN